MVQPVAAGFEELTLTTDHHLKMAAELGDWVTAQIRLRTLEAGKIVLWATACAHHGFAAQHCGKCGGSGIYSASPAQHSRCQECDNKGWIPRHCNARR